MIETESDIVEFKNTTCGVCGETKLSMTFLNEAEQEFAPFLCLECIQMSFMLADVEIEKGG